NVGLVGEGVLVDRGVRVPGDRGAPPADPELGLRKPAVLERPVERREERVRAEDLAAHALTSIGRSRNRAWAAPWPTRMSCSGSPFAQLRKPCSSQSSATPSQLPQKS